MSICDNLENLKRLLSGKDICVVAVSKTKPIEKIVELLDCGHNILGENKAQELVAKYEKLKEKSIEWHMVGHMQRNKVKYIAPFVSMIHSVDSLKLLKEINKQAKKHNRVIKCLLQFHIADEDSKFGLNLDECKNILKSEEFSTLNNVKICGVMGMATFTSNLSQVRQEFKSLKKQYEVIKSEFFANDNEFKEISMGMTNDWEIAVDEGATIIRIGTLIFGKR